MMSSFKERQFVRYMNKFSRDIFQCLKNNIDSDDDNKKNILFGPANIYALLSMLLAGAKGITLSELKNVMNIPDEEDDSAKPAIKAFYKLWKDTLKANSQSLTLANKLWISEDIVIKKTFKDFEKQLFAVIEGKDFSAPERVVSDINSWVKEQTHDKISNFLSEKDITLQSRLLAISIVYFKGKWKTPFEEFDTTQMLFYRLNNDPPINVSMMYNKSKYKYVEIKEYDCKVVSLAYEGKTSLEMMILLPNKQDGLPALEEMICQTEEDRDTNHFEIWKKHKLKNSNFIHLYLPKFKIKERVSLNSSLKVLGLDHLFVEADLNGISEDKALSSLSNISHTVFLEVDEEGTVATSSCSGEIVKAGVESKVEIEFKVDHPCLVMLYDADTEMIMFLGRLSQPV